jgi:hypothetical protein
MRSLAPSDIQRKLQKMAFLSASSATLVAASIDASFRTTYDEAASTSHVPPYAGSPNEKYQFSELFTKLPANSSKAAAS